VLRTILHLLLFLAGFVLTATWIHSLVPERQKLEWLDTVQEDVDVIFLGSSHVYRQFDPQLFDLERGAAAGDLRSINMGALGMGLNEESYLLQRILKERSPNLRWIVIEALPFDMQFQNENDFGKRRLEWHDSSNTWRLVQSLLQSELPSEEKWSLIRRHVEHWWRRSINLARGVDVAQAVTEEPTSFEGNPDFGVNQDGYVPLEMATATKQSRGMRQRFLNNPKPLLEAARALSELEAVERTIDDDLRSLVMHMEDRAAANGVGIIWWIHPNLERYLGWRKMKADGDIQHLVGYDDPKRYPAFYQVRWHFDLYHLNRKGAEMMTKIFAQDFATITKSVEEARSQ
jgi:hypothetical protein